MTGRGSQPSCCTKQGTHWGQCAQGKVPRFCGCRPRRVCSLDSPEPDQQASLATRAAIRAGPGRPCHRLCQITSGALACLQKAWLVRTTCPRIYVNSGPIGPVVLGCLAKLPSCLQGAAPDSQSGFHHCAIAGPALYAVAAFPDPRHTSRLRKYKPCQMHAQDVPMQFALACSWA